MNQKKHCTAVVLSAGQGRRMGSSVRKQYIELEGRPIVYYSLKIFEESSIIDDVILVVGEGQEEYVRRDIVEEYGLAKVRDIVTGGRERYESVWRGLQALGDRHEEDGYVFIHDGARPFVDEEILKRGYKAVEEYNACVAGMPSKDTVKLVNEQAFAEQTPYRRYVWLVQTPQIFRKSLIIEAYSRLMREDYVNVTDDAMVAEQMLGASVKLFEGSYENIKITTPEDMDIARLFLKRKNENIGN